MLQRDFLRLPIGKDLLDFKVEIVPFVFAPEIIEHHKPAVFAVAAERIDFVGLEGKSCRVSPAPRFAEVDEGVVVEPRVDQIKDDWIGIYLE